MNKKWILIIVVALVLIVIGANAFAHITAPSALIKRTIQSRRAHKADIISDYLDKERITVVLAGTSNPMSLTRAQTSTAVFVNGQFLLFDCGDGAERSMENSDLPMDMLDAVFISHFHADHFADLGEVIDRSFVMGRRKTLEVYGPTGIVQTVDGFLQAYALEFKSRTDHHGVEMMPPEFAGAIAVEFDGAVDETVVYEKDGVVVRAFKADHPPIEPGYGYVIEFMGKKVVISGDTLITNGLKKHAKDADLLVGDAMNKSVIELMEQTYSEMGDTFNAHIMHDIREYHMDITELAELSEAEGVKRLALNHLSPPPTNKLLMNRFFVKPIQKIYNGELIVGDDGTVVIIHITRRNGPFL